MDEMIEKVKNGYTLHIYKDKLELSTAVFKFIESHIIHTLKKKDRFKFCVSGGSTPKSVYKLLSKSDLRYIIRYHQILWSKPLPNGLRFDLDDKRNETWSHRPDGAHVSIPHNVGSFTLR